MDGKLIFDENYYSLEVVHERIGNMIVGSSDHELSKMINQPFKLSTKNCEAIKNGYDLDELAHNHAEGNDNYLTAENSFIEGAKTILELLGDKKFSERQVRKAIRESRACIADDDTGVKFLKEDADIVQSIQPKEWEVEIETEEKRIGGFKGYGEYEIVPKLDANGCIILKRK